MSMKLVALFRDIQLFELYQFDTTKAMTDIDISFSNDVTYKNILYDNIIAKACFFDIRTKKYSTLIM